MLKQVTIILVLYLGISKSLKQLRNTEQQNKYPAESHVATTKDGYKLRIYRLPYSPKLNNKDLYRPTVLLQHGFQSNSNCFACNGPDNSLAYLLADAGFDVWLGNTRGNTYSRENTNISPNNSSFWDFNWHQIGVTDVATMIDFVLENTQQPALHFIAHSQGTTAFLILVSSLPEYNDKIKTAHLLAPCAFYTNADAPQLKLAAPIIGKPGSIGYTLLKDRELLPNNPVISRIIGTLCGGENMNSWCSPIFKIAFKGPNSNTNQSALGIMAETHPAGCSSNQVIHNAQMAQADRFCQFDFGSYKNQQLYSQQTPPDYNLQNIFTKTYMYASQSDTTCTVADMKILISKMGNVAGENIVPVKNFGHLDFIIGNDARKYVNDPIIEILKDYEA